MTNASEQFENGILKIAEGTQSLPDSAYAGREDIEELILPDSLSSLGMECFAGCENLGRVRLPSALKEISPACFAECPRLRDISLPETLQIIGEGAFTNCESLAELRFPKGLRRIESFAFWGTGLEAVSLPEGLLEIGESAFWSCENLRQVDVPGRETRILENAFGSCYKLTRGYMACGYPECGDAPSELLFTLLWCSCPERHNETVSRRAESYIEKNCELMLERIFKYNNTAALSGMAERGLIPSRSCERYIRYAAEMGLNELTAVLLKAQGEARDFDGEFEL